MRKAASITVFILGLYLIARAVAEPFVIDMTDPATYRDDWGGPSLVGVLVCIVGRVAGRNFSRQCDGSPPRAKPRYETALIPYRGNSVLLKLSAIVITGQLSLADH